MKQINHNLTKTAKTMAPAILLILIFIGLAFTDGIEKPDIEKQFEDMEYNKFPFAEQADSILGTESRYSDYWCELANPEITKADSSTKFDYSFIFHNDSVWLFNSDGYCIRTGNFNKLFQYIEEDNL